MVRNTRSRQAIGAINSKRTVNKIEKQTVAKSISTTEKTSKVGNAKKEFEQDENAVPVKQIKKSMNKKSQPRTSALTSKQCTVETVNQSPVILKSPVLRDRTNTDSEITREKKVFSKQIIEANSKVSINNGNNTTVKKSDSKSNEVVQSSALLNSDKAERPVARKMCSAKEIQDGLNNDETLKTKEKNKTVSKKSSMLKKKNMSIEQIEDLLNDDDEDAEPSDGENDELHAKGSDKNESSCGSGKKLTIDEKTEENQKNKKFFKHKYQDEEDIKLTVASTRPRRVRRKVKLANDDDDESDIDVIMEAEKQSIEPVTRNLRCKSTKNYCELSCISQNSNSSNAKKPEDEEIVDKSIEKSDKNHLPIYMTKIELSQEKDKEEIYEFPVDSQDKGKKNFKKKKTIKKSVIKRPKKIINPKPVLVQKNLKKPARRIPQNVQFKVNNVKLKEKEIIDIINSESEDKHDNIPTSIQIRENITGNENIGVSRVPIKVISCEKLDKNRKICLTATPNVPKTINSELKLFGPTNAITLEPKSSYNNMINHSLMRQSMSPINKLNNDDFDDGSPWRPVDTFSRIKRVVQSTPLIKKPSFNREKKVVAAPALLSEKSIGSENTVNISSTDGLIKKNQAQTIENEKSPRKFGTEISNTNPVTYKSVENVHKAKTLIHSSHKLSPIQGISVQNTIIHNQQSPAKAISPQSGFSDYTACDQVPEESENIQPSPTKQKNKSTVPSPIGCEKIKTYNKSASNNKIGPVKLKQTNLNAYFNQLDMPESVQITTRHGIFDDISALPRSRKKPNYRFVEPGIENAFGFDDADTTDEISAIEPSPVSKIATEEDVRQSVKGKIFPNARVKSTLPSKNSKKAPKKGLLEIVLEKKRKDEKIAAIIPKDLNNSSVNDDTNKENDKTTNLDDLPSPKKALLHAVSFSDTFDVLSEKGDLESKIPEEIPLFVDLEPAHFSKPPRRSYYKRKREVCFNVNKEDNDDSDDDAEVKKSKLKKRKKDTLSKEDQKRMRDWVKSINETFEEVDHFDLVVE